MQDSTLDELAALQKRIESLPHRRAELIAKARAANHTWPEIAAALDMTVHGAIKASKPSETRQGRPRKT